ncbi:Rz1-like lysis system protein LysC [Pseudomonas aeruginosa]
MTRLFATGCVLVSLLVLAGCTPAPKPPILPPMVQPVQCPLTPCRLPGRAAPSLGEDMAAALDQVEAALRSCAVQVLGCIERQDIHRH